MKLLLTLPLLALLLCACNPGDGPKMKDHTTVVEAQATALADGKFDVAAFRAAMAPVVKKWDGSTYQPYNDRELKNLQAQFDRLVDEAEKSDNDEAKRLVADMCHVTDDRYITEKMKTFRDKFPAPEGDKWWDKKSAEGANTAGNAVNNAGG